MAELNQLINSWKNTEGSVESTDNLLKWISDLNSTIEVGIHKTKMQSNDFWFYDKEEGIIRNKTRSFFTISGIKIEDEDGIKLEQPIINQDEIGYLGILCKEINGEMNFLMQAKIEPGNINKIQISPTIQATKSNFTQKHGGRKPAYLDYFIDASKYNIIVDQIQSEQSSRFYKKRNRNILIDIGLEQIDILPTHKWMTLGQIKELMKIDNLVNMDTRTVISCIPYSMMNISKAEFARMEQCFTNKALLNSIFRGSENNCLPEIYQYINNYKMFCKDKVSLCSLQELEKWNITESGVECRERYPFKVIYCDIMIEGREVKHWKQPLFEAVGEAFFGLFCCEDEEMIKFLVSAKAEIGCFDGMELGPTLQEEAGSINVQNNEIVSLFFDKYVKKEGICYDVMLSEEGGRFYHEQNRNVIIQIDKADVGELPPGYFWMDFKTLNYLIQINNCVNIQLRNLLSLLEV